MKTLIIYAHPDTEGHCPAILAEIKKQLYGDWEVIDLYRDEYDPILHENEHYTAGREHRDICDKNLDIQERIAATDRLVFVYPVWWSTMPAILKGFFDRVLTVPFAFKYKYGVPLKMLKGKKAAVFMTTGAPWWGTWLFQGNRPFSIIRKDILGFCGIKAKVFCLYNAKKMSDERLPEIRSLVRKGLSFLS